MKAKLKKGALLKKNNIQIQKLIKPRKNRIRPPECFRTASLLKRDYFLLMLTLGRSGNLGVFTLIFSISSPVMSNSGLQNTSC